MKKIVPTIVLLLFCFSVCHAAPQRISSTPAQVKQQNMKKHKKKKLTLKEGKGLQKKAEKTGRQHQIKMQQREYQLMLEAQRRGMMQDQTLKK